jgi:signal peptidase I
MEPDAGNQIREKPRRPWIAAALTLLVPGLGQLYGGEPRRALVLYLGNASLFLALLVGGVFRTFAGLIVAILAFLLFLLWMIWDAVHVARGKKDYVIKPYNRWYLYLAIVLVSGLSWQHLRALSPVKTFWIPSASMEPALRIGDHLCADMTYYRSDKPSRGDLVVFTSSEDPASMRVTRVIGLEGEQVEIRDKVVYIDSQVLRDPWGHYRNPKDDHFDFQDPRLRLRDNFGPLKIPAGAAFILGDNRDNSYDSRFFGPIQLSSLRGRLLYVYWSGDRSRIGMPLR